MQIRLDKARKLIDDLEKSLNETASQTSSARDVLGQWITSGETTLRKKGAVALREVRKKADRFTGALNSLERHLAKSLDKLSTKIEAPTKKAPAAKKTAKKAAPAKKKTAKKAAKTAKKKSTAKKS